MIRVLCKYTKLTDVPDLHSVESYKERTNPLDYDFCLTVGSYYEVLGLIVESGIPRLYIIMHDEDFDVSNFPAVLFDFDWEKIPSGWHMRINGDSREEVELLPEPLVSVKHWFERYIDEEPEVLKIVNSLIHKNNPNYLESS